MLEPAAQLASEGFPVAPITAHNWQSNFDMITKWLPKDTDPENIPLSVAGNAPKAGEIITNPGMANVLRSLGQYGATDGFYNAFPGQAIAAAVQKHGGLMDIDDLKNHHSTYPNAIKATYRGVDLW